MPFFEDYGSNFHFYHTITNKGKSEMHLHPHHEICLIPQAYSDRVLINGKEYVLHTPVMLYHPPFCLHRLTFVPKIRTERFVCYFGDSMIQKYSNSFTDLEPYFNDNSAIFELSDELIKTIQPLTALMTHYSTSDEEQRLLFLLILNIVLHSDCEQIHIGTFPESKNICQIIRYMKEHMAEKLSAESVAKSFFISRSKLNQDFRKYTTMSFHQLLLEIRLCQATYLLREGKHDIGSIASFSGFENESYFFTVFKKKKGTTPLKYQKDYQALQKKKSKPKAIALS